jgi:hypothetical protein
MFLLCSFCWIGNTMDWDRAIERNSEALKDIVAALFAMLGLAGTDMAARNPPRIHIFGSDPRVAALWSAPQPLAVPAPPPDGLVNAARLSRRLQALKLALEDLPRQARRLARWRVRRETAPSPKFKSPLRPGHPPGYRRKPVHEVDEVLIECHGLACDALKPDTS